MVKCTLLITGKNGYLFQKKERGGGFSTAREAFEVLWDSLNAKRGYGWDVNPWVWVIEFKRVKR